ncbi:MAG: 5'-nucleotidase C-terminal domain-containing protein, partial [Clostridia bacterium]|nr:5'-nucleotidase C-terminal domain-containing protein [Clostridia bacterium]
HTDVDLCFSDPITEKRMARYRETNLGDLCADAYRFMSGADVAIVNGGAIRTAIPAGDITYGQMISVHPFQNEMCLIEITGQELSDALEYSVSKLPDEFGGFLQVSGMSFTVDLSVKSGVVIDNDGMFSHIEEGERRIKDILIGSEPLDPAKVYTLACHNYELKSMGDGYSMFADNHFIMDSVMIDNQVLINYIVKGLGGVVGENYADPYGQGRITIIGE